MLRTVLDQFQIRDGIYLISEPRRFQHSEEAYDEQYAIDYIQMDAFRREGIAIMGLCNEYGFQNEYPAVEIGCGTGRLSLSLLLSGEIREILLTDPSPAFCSITSQKISRLGTIPTHPFLAVLLSDDLDRLPGGAFSIVIMRSVLHHIADIPAFFERCARVLVPGGLLMFEEPCYEGYLLMGAMTQFVPDLLKARGVGLSKSQEHQIAEFIEAMKFYARRDINKEFAEDKHLFRPDELMKLSKASGMEMEFFPNRVFANIDKRNEVLPSNYFEKFFFDYLKYAMSWDDTLLGIIGTHMRQYLQYFSCMSINGAFPYTYGTFLCRKCT